MAAAPSDSRPMNSPNGSEKIPSWFIGSVSLYLIWGNQTLPSAWIHDPSNRTGAFAFLLWFGASLFMSLRTGFSSGNSNWWIASLILCLIGQLGSLEIMKQLALALAVTSFFHTSLSRIACFAGAFSWTPALGWMLREVLPFNPDFFRLPLLFVMLGIMFHSGKQKVRTP